MTTFFLPNIYPLTFSYSHEASFSLQLNSSLFSDLDL